MVSLPGASGRQERRAPRGILNGLHNGGAMKNVKNERNLQFQLSTVTHWYPVPWNKGLFQCELRERVVKCAGKCVWARPFSLCLYAACTCGLGILNYIRSQPVSAHSPDRKREWWRLRGRRVCSEIFICCAATSPFGCVVAKRWGILLLASFW